MSEEQTPGKTIDLTGYLPTRGIKGAVEKYSKIAKMS